MDLLTSTKRCKMDERMNTSLVNVVLIISYTQLFGIPVDCTKTIAVKNSSVKRCRRTGSKNLQVWISDPTFR